MANEREFEAPSEREALLAAAEALGVGVEDLDYTVLDEGAEGAFGLGARPARVRVRVPTLESPRGRGGKTSRVEPRGAREGEAPEVGDEGRADSSRSASVDDEEGASRWVGPAPEKAARALEVASELVRRMGWAADVAVRDEHEEIVVVIRDAEGHTDVTEAFAHGRPPLVASFQFLLNKIVNRFPVDRKHVVIDAPERRGGARPDRDAHRGDPKRPSGEEFDPELVALARLLAGRAVEMGRIITVHPMRAGDRRAVHQTVMGLSGVTTVSTGEGLYRRMHIVPADAGGGSSEGGGPRRRRRGRRPGGGGRGGSPARV